MPQTLRELALFGSASHALGRGQAEVFEGGEKINSELFRSLDAAARGRILDKRKYLAILLFRNGIER